MSKKKKIIIIVSVVLMAALLIAAAVYFLLDNRKEEKPSLNDVIDNRIAAYETDMLDSLATMKDQSSVAKYLRHWAENKGIDVKVDKHDNVIYSIPATQGMEHKPPVVIMCGYDYACMDSYMDSIACALTVSKNDEPHAEYRVIFVSEENGDKTNAEALSDNYFTADTQVFYLNSTSQSRISVNSGGFSRYMLSKKLDYTAVSYDKAYKINVTGIPAFGFGSDTVYVPNPIKILGKLLANLKSSSVLFEIADFDGGVDANSTPQSASLTVVINADSAAKFESTLEKAISKLYDKYSDDYPNLQYTYEVVDTPAEVISTEGTESIVSLLYTAIDGVHYKDDNGNIASITNIGALIIEDGILKIDIAASSYSGDLITEVSDAYQTISALTDVDFECTEAIGPFEANKNGEKLSADFLDSYSNYKNTGLEIFPMADWTPCAAINAKNADMPIIVLGVTPKTKDNFAGGLITYLRIPLSHAS